MAAPDRCYIPSRTVVASPCRLASPACSAVVDRLVNCPRQRMGTMLSSSGYYQIVMSHH